jgi:ribosomal protein RSM22 (predicted rRNA methylase)
MSGYGYYDAENERTNKEDPEYAGKERKNLRRHNKRETTKDYACQSFEEMRQFSIHRNTSM